MVEVSGFELEVIRIHLVNLIDDSDATVIWVELVPFCYDNPDTITCLTLIFRTGGYETRGLKVHAWQAQFVELLS